MTATWGDLSQQELHYFKQGPFFAEDGKPFTTLEDMKVWDRELSWRRRKRVTKSKELHVDVYRVPGPDPDWCNSPMDIGSSLAEEWSKYFLLYDIYYWYHYGGYDGAGEALVRSPDGWQLCSLGHCSCYGPEENNLSSGDWWPKLSKLWEACTREHQKYVECLFKATERKYK